MNIRKKGENKMKKIISWIMTLFIIIGQLLPITQVVIATSTEGIFNIDEVYDADNEASKLEFKLKDGVEIDRIEIEFSKEIEYIKNISQIENAISNYNAHENKLTLTEIQSGFNTISLGLKNIQEKSGKVTITSYQESQIVNKQYYSLSNHSKEDTLNKKVLTENIVQSTVTSDVRPYAGDLNTDISVTAMDNKVLSGRTAGYKVAFKLTGSKQAYEDMNLIIDLPLSEYTEFNQDLNQLAIKNVVPRFDAESKQIIYRFEDKLKAGETFETIINIQTKNIITPNNYELPMKATLSYKENSKQELKEYYDEDIIIVTSSKEVVATKKFVESIKDKESSLVASPGSETIWQIKVNIPKREYGTMGLKSGTKIIVEDTFSKEMSYLDVMNGTPEPTKVDSNKLRWEIDVPPITEQEKSEENIFSIDLWVKLKVDNKPDLIGKNIKNTVEANATFVDGEKLLPPVTDTVEIGVYDSKPGSGDIEGSMYMAPVHLGPKDGKGEETGTNKEKDPNPQVYDDAYLKFTHGMSAMQIGGKYDMKSYTTIYTIDDNLNFNQLKTPGNWIYARNRSEIAQARPLERKPVFDIILELEDGTTKIIENAESNQIYTRVDLGLNAKDKVKVIKYQFKDAPAGMFALNNGEEDSRAHYFFYPEKGYIGEVKNTYNVEVEPHEKAINEWNDYAKKNGSLVRKIAKDQNKWWYRFNMPSTWNELASDRHANIVPRPPNTPPVATVGVELLNQSDGYIQAGKNTMKINFTNQQSSLKSIDKPIEAVVLLPFGVTLADKVNAKYSANDNASVKGAYEIVSDNYNNSGRQLVKVSWDEDRIRVGKKFTSELDVVVAEMPSSRLQFSVYGFSGEEEIKVPITNSQTLTNTIIEIDSEDLNKDGDDQQKRLKSGNEYYMFGQYDLQSQKFIKKSTDKQWTKDIQKVLPGDFVDYKLSMTNSTKHTFESMVLIDVLPSVGDLGITDNIQRGSQFTPNLNGPVKIPTEWVGKVDILYSTSKNPKRDDLIKNTKYPEGTTQLYNPEGSEDPEWMTEAEVNNWNEIHSFKIEMKSEANWLPGENMDVVYQVKAPSCDDIANGIAEVVELDDIEINQSDDVIKVSDKEYRLNNILNKGIPKELRLTSNSFAVATDHGQPVESKHVDFYMEIDSSLKIKKVDEKDKTPLAGAEFELYDSEGRKINLSQKLVTDKTGELFVEGLKPGKYKLKEIKAPKGYTLLTKDIDFEIACDNEGNELIITNSKQGWDLPSTGGIGTIIFYIVGLVIMGFAGYKWVSRKDKVKPN